MLNRKHLANEAAAKALSLRKRMGVNLEDAICPIDIAEALQIEVRLVDLPSMEGMYVAGDVPKILLSCLRPQGRRNFTCAHEIGHHIMGHGQQFDEMNGEKSARRAIDPREFSANCFAAYFLMPKATVDSGVVRREFRYPTLKPEQAYAVASWLGVGYKTFINHLDYGLGMVSRIQADRLRKQEPRTIRQAVLGKTVASHLHVVSPAWSGRAIDCEVGDYLLLPDGAICEGAPLGTPELLTIGTLVQTQCTGIGRVSSNAGRWAAFVRVSRHHYVGRSRYRFEEETDE